MTATPSTDSRIANSSRSWQAVCDVDISNKSIILDFILSTWMQTDAPHGNETKNWKLQWKESGGSFADVGADTEISFSATTVLVNDNDLAGGTSATCQTFGTGEESEGNNAQALKINSGDWGEIQWALSFGSAVQYETTYEFQIVNTDDATSAVCSCSVTTEAAPGPWDGESHNWRIYEEDDLVALANENVKPTGVGQTEAFSINWCVNEIGGDTPKTNATLDVEYSDDESTWYTLGAQAATNKLFRWNDGVLTEHGGFINVLTCREDNDKLHESACSDYDDVANSDTELVICLEGYNPTYNTTYSFRLKIDGVYIDLSGSPGTYPQVQIETAPVAWTGTVDGVTDPTYIDGVLVANINNVDGV